MIIVTGRIGLSGERIDDARRAALEMVAETRKEPGCIAYEFSQVLGEDKVFRVYEEWSDLDSLQAHFDTPHMARFRAALADIGVAARDVYRMEAGAKTSLG